MSEPLEARSICGVGAGGRVGGAVDIPGGLEQNRESPDFRFLEFGFSEVGMLTLAIF